MAVQGLVLAAFLLTQGTLHRGTVGGAAPSLQNNAPQASAIAFDQKNAWKWLLAQCDLGPRYPGSTQHIKCRDLILEETKRLSDSARLQEFKHRWSVDGKSYSMWNIIGEHNWASAKVRVTLFAHWDTRPTANMEPDSDKARKPIVGANDGASGVAVLLELMRHTRNIPKELGIRYVFLDGEDLGPDLDEMFLGAKHFAKTMALPKSDYGILLDMIGDKDLKVPVEPNSYRYAPDVIRAIYTHAKTIGLEKTFPFNFGPYIEDDHIPLNAAGLKTIDLIDFDYKPWHTLGDTPDKCSPESLFKVGKLLETWLMQPVPWKPKTN